jgi:CDP-6-deoxy-D-xylo-4-hexulose-3-dehydrase
MLKSEKIKMNILSLVEEYYLETQEEKRYKTDDTFIPYAGRVYDEEELTNLVNASLDFWLTSGEWTKEFERKFSSFLGIKYAHFVNSGSSANLLAFMALTSPLLKERQIKRGDEVITTACCFPTTLAPIVQYGAIPIFVDVDVNGNLDPQHLERAITKKTKAIMTAHTLGNPFDVKKIKNFCDEHNLWLIEDNCDALGSKVGTLYTGTFGDIGTSSFYPPHHITTGEGGMVYTNNKLLSKIILSMRDWGRDCSCQSGEDNKCKKRFTQKHGNLPEGYDHKYVYSHMGYNLKATEMQAAIGIAQLKKLPNFIQARQKNWMLLKNGLHYTEAIDSAFPSVKSAEPSWFGFLITIHDERYKRNEITQSLENKGIQTRNLFAGNILLHPCMQNVVYRVVDELKNTNKIMNDSFWIGVYPGLTKENLTYIIKQIQNCFN